MSTIVLQSSASSWKDCLTIFAAMITANDREDKDHYLAARKFGRAVRLMTEFGPTQAVNAVLSAHDKRGRRRKLDHLTPSPLTLEINELGQASIGWYLDADQLLGPSVELGWDATEDHFALVYLRIETQQYETKPRKVLQRALAMVGAAKTTWTLCGADDEVIADDLSGEDAVAKALHGASSQETCVIGADDSKY